LLLGLNGCSQAAETFLYQFILKLRQSYSLEVFNPDISTADKIMEAISPKDILFLGRSSHSIAIESTDYHMAAVFLILAIIKPEFGMRLSSF
jgi:hypothetical protein